MRIAVVDDESVFRKQITEKIASLYGREDVSCYHYSDGAEVIRSFENGFELDAVFLDIEMKELDGMSTARKIREYNKEIPIIFITSHTEKALDGYEVDAFRFLSKPIDEEKLRQALTDLEKLLKVDNKIVLRQDGEDMVFSVSELKYAEAANNSVRFVLASRVVEQRMKFSDAMKMIDEKSSDFIKIHRSYYINLAHVVKINTSDVLMDNKELLPVARGTSATVKQALFDYVRRTGR